MEKHILLVDDDPLLRRSLSFNLERSGYRANAAASAEEALALVQGNPTDLVLLDIGLPGMDGLDALRQFRSRFTTPMIFLTARRRELDEVLGLELGADDYITKPFDLDVLLARIRVVLRRTLAAAPARAPLVEGDLTIDRAYRRGRWTAARPVAARVRSPLRARLRRWPCGGGGGRADAGVGRGLRG
jgi:DNA-binding response OmpR family regulator